MKLNELIADFAAVDARIEITGISTNSRELKAGNAFIVTETATIDYVRQAIEKGAAAILFEHDLTDFQDKQDFSAVAWVKIENLPEKLPEIAARFYDFPAQKLEIIGITGTNGKTSCSQFLAQVLIDSMVIGTLGFGTWGNVKMTGYTTPDVLTLQKILAQAVELQQKTVVMEVSSHGVQEKRIDQTLFKGAVFTNLSRDHLDYHNSMEEYFNAKLQLFKRPELEFAVINRDDEYGQKIIAEIAPSVALWTFSRENLSGLNAHQVQAKNIHCSIHGIQFEVVCGEQYATVNSRLFGEFNVENLLAVLTTLLALGFDLPTAVEKISALQSVCGRMEYFGGDEQPTVFVDFAHTPDALEKVLQSIKHHQPKFLTVVFGCGGNRDAGKRPLMGAIAEKYADNVIVTDDNPRFEDGEAIVAAILSGCENQTVTVIRDRALAIQTAISQAKKGDCVVVAGKGHEDYQEVRGAKSLFSDQKTVETALEQWMKKCN